jgi:hypothetical protein
VAGRRIDQTSILRVSAGITRNGHIVPHQTAIFYRPGRVKLISGALLIMPGFAYCVNMQPNLQNGNDQCTELSASEIARACAEYDYIDLDFHLTPNGWVMGDIRCVFRDVNMTKPAPVDRVLTLTHRTHKVSTHSNQLRSVKVAWRAEASDGQIAELRAKYPPPFNPEDESTGHAQPPADSAY